MSNSSVINTLNVLYDSFAQKEKLVANYVLEHPRDVVNMTSRDLASTCDTSVTTITRLTKKCGVESFHQFKVILARDLVLNDEDVKVSSSISMQDVHGSLLNIQANKIEELKATIALIDEDAITKVINHIKDSSCVQIVAVGNTIPVAINAEYMFNEIGIRAVSGTIWETQLEKHISSNFIFKKLYSILFSLFISFVNRFTLFHFIFFHLAYFCQFFKFKIYCYNIIFWYSYLINKST